MLSKAVPPLHKSGLGKKVGIMKIACAKTKPGPRGTSKIELSLVKPIGVSKKIHLLDLAGSSHRPSPRPEHIYKSCCSGAGLQQSRR
jgi:hypothetical protein